MGTIFNKGNTPLKLKHLALATLTALLSACSQSEPPKPVADPAAQAEIDSSIYFRGDDPTDPYRALYAEFRERRAADMANPELPKPLAHYQATHFTRNMDWSDLETVLPFEWGKLDPTKAQALKNAVKMRLAFDHPDLKIVQIMVGPGGVMPAHAGGAPGLYIGVGGTGEVTREGATQTLTPGTTVKLNPYDVRRVTANDGDTPLKLLWIRWGPGGDQAFIDAGYYLTGSNQHIQPETADMPLDYKFWGTVYDTKTLAAPSIPVITPSDGSFFRPSKARCRQPALSSETRAISIQPRRSLATRATRAGQPWSRSRKVGFSFPRTRQNSVKSLTEWPLSPATKPFSGRCGVTVAGISISRKHHGVPDQPMSNTVT